MYFTFRKIFSKLTNLLLVASITLVTIVLLLSATQFHIVVDMFSLFGLTNPKLWTSLISILTTSFSILSVGEAVVLILLTFSVGVNTVLFVMYLKQYRRQLSFAGSHLTLTALLLGVFGVGCISCGILLLAPVISVFGLSAAVWITNYGIVMSITGLLLVLYSNYLLLKKISDPQLCTTLN